MQATCCGPHTPWVRLCTRKSAVVHGRSLLDSAGQWFPGNRFPIDAASVCPETFQIVQVACFGQHDMQDDVPPVLQQPRTDSLTLRAGHGISPRLHQDSRFTRQRGHRARVVTGRDDKVVHNRSDRCQIQDHGLFAAKFLTSPRNLASIGQALLLPSLLLRSQWCSRRGRVAGGQCRANGKSSVQSSSLLESTNAFRAFCRRCLAVAGSPAVRKKPAKMARHRPLSGRATSQIVASSSNPESIDLRS